MVGSDSDSGLVTTAPGDSDSGSDPDSATGLVLTTATGRQVLPPVSGLG